LFSQKMSWRPSPSESTSPDATPARRRHVREVQVAVVARDDEVHAAVFVEVEGGRAVAARE
jgi:hypothetical protein